MNRKEFEEYLDSIRTTLDNIENEVKDFAPCDFMAIMSTTVDVYAKNHNIPAMKLWAAMYETAHAVNEVLPL